VTRRDRRDDATSLGLEGEISRRPVRDRQSEIRRVFAGQRDNVRKLLGTELARRATALFVGQHVDDQLRELLVGRLLTPLSLDQARTLVAPAVSPA
jgi:hypothetical protein